MDLPITLERPLVFLDLETTGLNIDYDRIVELAILRINERGDVIERVRRFNPGIPITPGAMEVHKITDQDVAHEPPFSARARSLAKLLEGADISGFNIRRFDLPMLVKEFERAGVPFSLEGRNIVDAQVIFHAMEPRDLSGAARFYLNRDHLDAHTALGDIRISAHVLWAQLRRYSDLPRDLRGLHEFCEEARPTLSERERWFDDRGNGDYLFKRGKHRGKLLSHVVREDPSYLEWMLRADEMDDGVLELVRGALNPDS
jgi:DNA polymerase-3 subunit epsilon